MSLDAGNIDESQPLTQVAQLVRTLHDAGRREAPLLVGIEHEKLLFPADGAGAVPYDGPTGIGALFTALEAQGYRPFREAPGLAPIAMQRGPETVSLEPGGQLELSGTPQTSAREAHAENVAHMADLEPLLRALGLRAVGLGYRPFLSLEEMPWMPKRRYQTMRRTLGARGRLAHDMMLMTAGAQASFDWRDEADAARKVAATVRLTPVLVALFANSPIARGRPTGYLSWRSRVWDEVDPARCGYPQCTLDGSFSFEAWVDWVIDAPMLFLRRGDGYHDPGCTFRQLLEKGWGGGPALVSDWADHLSTMFPEVRLKRVLEVRSADAVDVPMAGALAAFMQGALYDDAALDEVLALIPIASPDAHRALHAEAQRVGLEARVGRGTLADVARAAVGIARRGLGRIDPLSAPLLEPLEAVAERGTSPAREVLKRFEAGAPPERFLSAFEL